MRIKDEVYKGGLRVTVSEDALREAIKRAYGLPKAAKLEAVFGNEGADAMTELARLLVVDAIETQLADMNADLLYKHMKNADRLAPKTA